MKPKKYKEVLWAVVERFGFFIPDLLSSKKEALQRRDELNVNSQSKIFYICKVEVREI
jgi:hypothetical protein